MEHEMILRTIDSSCHEEKTLKLDVSDIIILLESISATILNDTE